MLPVMDERHQEIRNQVQYITAICLSEEFLALKKELEKIYKRSTPEEHAAILAFQDALYSILAQEEIGFSVSRAF